MVDEEQGSMGGKQTCDAVEGGYTIFLDGAAIAGFMDSGDFSSARELDHFKDVVSKLESRIGEGSGLSLLALSITENRIARDYSVLQVAHLLAKHGKNVLIVDCDFLHPGLSGLVEHVDELGFLDLLLYGSSIKSISRSIGIYDVGVTGPGSFPVSKALPFALKEFDKAKNFLSRGRDVVIYCSTLYVERDEINPLSTLVDGILLSCQIEEMGEGELQRTLKRLGPKVPPVDLVCFCAKKEHSFIDEDKPAESITSPREVPGEEIELTMQDKPVIAAIEKTEEIDSHAEQQGRSLNLPRIITIAAAIILVVFIIWWILINRTIREKESTQQLMELVQKQRDVREASEDRPAERESDETVTGGETGTGAVVDKPPDATGQPPSAEGGDIAASGQESQKPLLKEYFTIHVSSFRYIARAKSEVEFLKSKGFDPSIVELEVRGETWFRVLVGEFETQEEAGVLVGELRPLNRSVHSRIIKMKRD